MKATLDPIYVDVYLRCRANPAFHIPGPQEDTYAFVIDMERKLSAIPQLSQQIVCLLAQGYSKAEISRRTSASPRTVTKHVRDIFWDGPNALYTEALGYDIPEVSIAVIKRSLKEKKHVPKAAPRKRKSGVTGSRESATD